MTQRRTEFVTFGILPTEEEKAKRRAGETEGIYAGMYLATAFDELRIIENALRLYEDPAYAEREARLFEEEHGQRPPPLPTGEEADRIKRQIRADIEALRARLPKEIPGTPLIDGEPENP